MPTLMVVLVVPTLIGFGIWQLQRAEWKAALLADLASNADAPVVSLSPGVIPDALQFRRVRLMLGCPEQQPAPRAGRNAQGASGYSVFVRCDGNGQPMLVNAGWGLRPDSWSGNWAAGAGIADGVLVKTGTGDPEWMLVAADVPPPLLPSAPPSVDTISNNHRSYAIQWFSFAAILAVIYGLYLRRWLAQPAPTA